MNKNMFWHYSAGIKLPMIVKSGVLRGSNIAAENELPMLWFSANQQWEHTATKMLETKPGFIVTQTFQQQAESIGCIRFGLAADDSRLLNWKDACTVAGTPKETRRELEKMGKEIGGDPAHWFATTSTIPLLELHFQVWQKGWRNTPLDVQAIPHNAGGIELPALLSNARRTVTLK